MSNTQDLLRRRFHEATAEVNAIRAKSAPLRAERDRLAKEAQAIEARMRTLADQMRAIEAPLFDLDNERGTINRALSGKTG